RSAFEGRIRGVRVGPLGQDSLVLRRSRSRDRRSCRVARNFQAGKVRIVGNVGAGKRGVLYVYCVKLSIPPIVGIEVEAVQPVSITGFDCQLMEDACPAFTTVEI